MPTPTRRTYHLKLAAVVTLVAAVSQALALTASATADPNTLPEPNDTSAVSIPNALGETGLTPAMLAGRVIQALLGVSGAAALVVFIYGGLMFMLSGGKSERVNTAKSILIYASLGLAIIFASYAILQFVLQAVGGTTTPEAS
jgi:hypothetical protein